MNQYFKNILVPIDLSVNTEVAVKKAIDLAEAGTHIHLLHVQKSTRVWPAVYEPVSVATDLFEDIEVGRKVTQWRDLIVEHYPMFTVSSAIVKELPVQEAIIRAARGSSADLIIIGKNSHHSWLPFLNTVIPSEVSKASGCMVLTVKPGGIYKKVKTIVVPVSDENAVNKLGVVYAICKRSPAKIYLAAFTNSDEASLKFYTKAFFQLYQSLRGAGYQVDYTVLKNNNKAKAILKYAEQLGADILLVNPETETRIGWPNRHISDVLPVGSKLQVWAV